jgi:hypothetical protein
MVNYFLLKCSSDSSQNQDFSVTNINYENNASAAKLKYFIKYSFKVSALIFLGFFAFFVSGIDFDEDIIFRKEESNYTATILRVSRDIINLCMNTDESNAPLIKCTIPPIDITYFESDVLEYPTGPSPPVFMSAA